MVTVQVDWDHDKYPLEKALHKFKRELDKEGIFDELKKREFYIKPSAKKHQQKVRMERSRKIEDSGKPIKAKKTETKTSE
jgi:small subunit ribosomal protein S21